MYLSLCFIVKRENKDIYTLNIVFVSKIAILNIKKIRKEGKRKNEVRAKANVAWKKRAKREISSLTVKERWCVCARAARFYVYSFFLRNISLTSFCFFFFSYKRVSIRTLNSTNFVHFAIHTHSQLKQNQMYAYRQYIDDTDMI